MLFLPDPDMEKINELIFSWSGQYYNTEHIAQNFAILNCDYELPQIPKNMTVISCGMSGKATVTASSIEPEGFVCCIQREFYTLDGKLIEPSEFYLPMFGKDISTALFAATANLIKNGIFFQQPAYDL